LATAINAATAETGVTATADGTGALTLTSADGLAISVEMAGSATTARTGLTAGTYTTAEAANQGAEIVGFADLNISTASGADVAIVAMDAALKSVNDARADLGAVQNRFSSV